MIRLTPPATDHPTVERSLEFDDHRLAGDLYGQFDQHLAIIEQRLGIEANARGTFVNLSGAGESVAIAGDVLEGLYQRLRRGEEVGPSEVEAAIRVMNARSVDQGQLPGIAGLAQISTRRRTVTARSPNQDRYLRLMKGNELVFGIGPAGTGKTYLAVAHAAALLERGEVERIILSRPAVEAGERLGFLPGDMREKVDPYLRPLYDALYDMMSPERVERGLQTNAIEIAPLAFMRGRTLSHAAVILDEAQNCTPMQMKMFLTRLGEGGRMIVTGDPSQVDLPAGHQSGLADAVHKLDHTNGIGVVEFKSVDVVRHPLVQRIVEAYEGRSDDERQS